MSDTIAAAKAEFDRAKGRLFAALDATPDDVATWSPSPTSRTPIELVVHCAFGTKGIKSLLAGEMKGEFNPVAIDTMSRQIEADVKTKDQAKAMMDDAANEFHGWLDSLSAEQVASTLDLPFGARPLAEAITFPADHIRGHAAQLDYIQTIHGDREWR